MSPHKFSENKRHKVDKTDTDEVPMTVDIKYTQDHELKPGQYLEPVIFEPVKKIRLSRSTYKVSSLLALDPITKLSKHMDIIYSNLNKILMTHNT